MHDVDMFKLILIPLKSVGGIIVVKYQVNNTISNDINFKTNKQFALIE